MGLIITRRPGEEIDITLEDGRRITIAVISVKGNSVGINVNAPKTIVVDRSEITRRKEIERGEISGNE